MVPPVIVTEEPPLATNPQPFVVIVPLDIVNVPLLTVKHDPFPGSVDFIVPPFNVNLLVEITVSPALLYTVTPVDIVRALLLSIA